MDKELQRNLFIRICKDSGFNMSHTDAAILAAKVLGCSPLEIRIAMPSMSVMEEIAKGTHPCVKSS